MRHIKILTIFLMVFSPVKIFSQTGTPASMDITGLWKGTLFNDTTKQFYRYEIGISEDKGKLSGFSHTWFLLDDKQYYGVKKVKIKRADGKIIVEDAGLIANNYPESPAKGVRQLNVLTLEIRDSVLILTGPFSTNRTKEYSPLTGFVNLQRKNDYRQSALVPHLQELGLENNLSFVAKDNALAKAEAEKSLEKRIQPDIKLENSSTHIVAKNKANIKTPDKNPVKTEAIPMDRSVVATDAATSMVETPNEEMQRINLVSEKPAKVKVSDKTISTLSPAAEVTIRKTEVQQTVYFKSDSLQLSLYDNGEVDGDTVSVLMNGDLIMAMQRLSTNAIRKTIYTDPGTDSILLVMYAENLGSIAPNTGLLVVRDGQDVYEIRFSGDLQKNAAIILKRRKK